VGPNKIAYGARVELFDLNLRVCGHGDSVPRRSPTINENPSRSALEHIEGPPPLGSVARVFSRSAGELAPDLSPPP
jgi:hypothetical protein